jgi:hypothetical protein
LQRALRAKGVQVFALTNFGKHSFEEAVPMMDFLQDFDRLYVSGRMGVIKPDPRIYAMVEADCGIAPDRLLFTDDRFESGLAHTRYNDRQLTRRGRIVYLPDAATDEDIRALYDYAMPDLKPVRLRSLMWCKAQFKLELKS